MGSCPCDCEFSCNLLKHRNGHRNPLNLQYYDCISFLLGSDVKYNDSMNLRNILWLAPLPSNSSPDWVAPGIISVFISESNRKDLNTS